MRSHLKPVLVATTRAAFCATRVIPTHADQLRLTNRHQEKKQLTLYAKLR